MIRELSKATHARVGLGVALLAIVLIGHGFVGVHASASEGCGHLHGLRVAGEAGTGATGTDLGDVARHEVLGGAVGVVESGLKSEDDLIAGLARDGEKVANHGLIDIGSRAAGGLGLSLAFSLSG